MLKMTRMALFTRVSRVRPVSLLRLLEASAHYSGSWLKAVDEDFDWLTSVTDTLADRRSWSLNSWAHAARDDPKSTKKEIATVCRRPEANVCSAWATSVAHRSLGEQWVCDECSSQCKSKQALAAHKFKKHGVTRLTRHYVGGTHCVACLRQFHERNRLIQHLERASPRCRQEVLARLPKLCPEIVQRLDQEAAAHVRRLAAEGRSRVHAALPCVRLNGPLLPVDDSRRRRCSH